MRNIKLRIEYDGTNYCGWQIQNCRSSLLPRRQAGVSRRSKKSIQETIEKVLQRILQEKVSLIGSGRTDAGVHAKAQVANFKTNSNMALKKLFRALNGLLPKDISISAVRGVGPDFHSRYNAKSKIYCYSILNSSYPSALLRDRVYHYHYPLNIRLMQKESKVLLGRHNFSSFQVAKSRRNPLKKIKKIKIVKEGNLIYIYIEADGFLHNMVRNIAGTLAEIGRGRFPEGFLRKILLSGDRKLAGPTLPARGLCLLRVRY